jgi:hypothetical protein
MGGSLFVSHRTPLQVKVAVELAQSFALDNGAFNAWSEGNAITDWKPFYEWAGELRQHPACDFAVVPDVIDGSEADNDALLAEWPLPKWFGAPVWHMHESLERLERLAADWPRICLGSSGEFKVVGGSEWWTRMASAMRVLCDTEGRPQVKIHGLRMLNPKVFTRLPFSSADSTNIGRNIGLDQRWKGTYAPVGKVARARVMRQRIEAFNSPPVWDFSVPEAKGLNLWD